VTITYQNRQKGVALLLALVLLMLITAVAFGLIIMSNTENSINNNFKGEETEYFAARAGVEEARNRILPGAVDQNGNSVAFTAAMLPSLPPDTPGGKVLYILNGVTLAQVTTPPAAGNPNPFFDDQLCHDIPGGAGGIVKVPANVRCTTILPAAMITTTASVAPYPLDYKWVRVMIKENSSGPYTAVNGQPATFAVCWDKSLNPPAEVATLLATDCAAAPAALPLARPVYLVTALAVNAAGTTRRLVQEEISLGITFNPSYSVYGVSPACPGVQFTGNGKTASFTAVAGNTSNPPPGVNTVSGADVGSNGGIALSGNSAIAGNADVASNPVCFTPDKIGSPAAATPIAPQVFPVSPAPNPAPPTTSTNYTSDTTLTPGNLYGNISGSGKATITLQVPDGQGTAANPATFVMNSLSLSGQSQVVIAPKDGAACGGTTTCYVHVILAGNGAGTPLSLSGGSLDNPSGIPETVVFNVTQPTGCAAAPCGTVQITGGAATYAIVNAPMDDVKVTGNGDIFGSLISYTTTDTGNGTIYHDTNAGNQYIPDPYLHLIAFRELNY